jgi:hypothetical protein
MFQRSYVVKERTALVSISPTPPEPPQLIIHHSDNANITYGYCAVDAFRKWRLAMLELNNLHAHLKTTELQEVYREPAIIASNCLDLAHRAETAAEAADTAAEMIARAREVLGKTECIDAKPQWDMLCWLETFPLQSEAKQLKEQAAVSRAQRAKIEQRWAIIHKREAEEQAQAQALAEKEALKALKALDEEREAKAEEAVSALEYATQAEAVAQAQAVALTAQARVEEARVKTARMGRSSNQCYTELKRAEEERAAQARAAQQVVASEALVAFKDALIQLYLERTPVWVDIVGRNALMAFKACVDGELQRRDITVPHWPPVALREAYSRMSSHEFLEPQDVERPQVLEYLHQTLDSLDDSSSEKQFVQSVLDVAICVKALTNDTGFYSERYLCGPLLRGHREWFRIAMLGIQAVSAACRDVQNLEPDHDTRVEGGETVAPNANYYLDVLYSISGIICQPPTIGNTKDFKPELASGVI